MDTTIIFNTDSKLKAAAQKKARAQGLTLSAMLNLATRAFVDDPAPDRYSIITRVRRYSGPDWTGLQTRQA